MQQYFRVGLRDEPVPEVSELLRQLDVVVDFPVEDDPQSAIAVAHRLVARRRQVEYRKAAHSEPDRTLQVQPRVIGSAVDQTVSHSLEQRPGYRRAVGAQDSYDPAHGSASVRALRRVIFKRPRAPGALRRPSGRPYMPAPRRLKLASTAAGQRFRNEDPHPTNPTPMASVAASG